MCCAFVYVFMCFFVCLCVCLCVCSYQSAVLLAQLWSPGMSPQLFQKVNNSSQELKTHGNVHRQRSTATARFATLYFSLELWSVFAEVLQQE